MKYLLLLLALLLTGGPAGAQALSPAARPDSLRVPRASAPAAPDTVAALHRLFATRRQRRNILAGAAVGAALVGTAIMPSDRFFSTGDYAKLYGLGALVIVATDFVFGIDYSRKQEQRAIESCQAHQLPQHLRRQLKAKYFR